MQQRNQAPISPIEKAMSKYTAARSNLLAVTAFTAINIILAVVNANLYMLFSAEVPYVFAITGISLYAEGYSIGVLIGFVIVSLILTVPYLLCWYFSKKNYGWMIAALVYFSIDCVLTLAFFDLSMIIDALFHAWVLYYLIIGVKYGKQAQPYLRGNGVITAEGVTVSADMPDDRGAVAQDVPVYIPELNKMSAAEAADVAGAPSSSDTDNAAEAAGVAGAPSAPDTDNAAGGSVADGEQN